MNVGPHVSVVLPVMGTAGRPGDPGHIVATAQAAEQLGFDAAWTGDHIHLPWPMLESLVALCFAAAIFAEMNRRAPVTSRSIRRCSACTASRSRRSSPPRPPGIPRPPPGVTPTRSSTSSQARRVRARAGEPGDRLPGPLRLWA
jgi:hypothetical protein